MNCILWISPSLSFFSSPPSTLLYLIWITEKKYLGWKRISSSNEIRGLLAHASMCYLNLPLLSTTVVRRFVIHHDVDFHNENELILVFISRRIITGWTGFYAATSQGYTLVMLDLLLRLVSFNEFFSPLFFVSSTHQLVQNINELWLSPLVICLFIS